jgi:mannitol/fructose-specific phosphotransferase system IIA component (Ntr-type)
MGWLAVVFCVGVIGLGVIWYIRYAASRVSRHGALYHVFERLGRKRDDAVDRELRGVMGEKGLNDEDPFEHVVAHAEVVEMRGEQSFSDVARQVAHRLESKINMSKDELVEALMNDARTGLLPMAEGVAAPTLQDSHLEMFEMVLVRARDGVKISMERSHGDLVLEKPIYAFIFLLSPKKEIGTHLRILAHLAEYADNPGFIDDWLNAADEDALRDLLLRDERFCHFVVEETGPCADFAGQRLRDIRLPHGVLVALVRREGETFVPDADTRFRVSDRITLIGNPEGMLDVREKFLGGPTVELRD